MSGLNFRRFRRTSGLRAGATFKRRDRLSVQGRPLRLEVLEPRAMLTAQFTNTFHSELGPLCSGSVVWGDYNNDGLLDLLKAGEMHYWSEYVTKIYRNNGNNLSFTRLEGLGLQGIGNGTAAWGDYNNDGRLDILMTGYFPAQSYTKVYRSNGGDSFTEIVTGPLFRQIVPALFRQIVPAYRPD